MKLRMQWEPFHSELIGEGMDRGAVEGDEDTIAGLYFVLRAVYPGLICRLWLVGPDNYMLRPHTSPVHWYQG